MKMIDEGQKVKIEITYREAECLFCELSAVSEEGGVLISKLACLLDEYINT